MGWADARRPSQPDGWSPARSCTPTPTRAHAPRRASPAGPTSIGSESSRGGRLSPGGMGWRRGRRYGAPLLSRPGPQRHRGVRRGVRRDAAQRSCNPSVAAAPRPLAEGCGERGRAHLVADVREDLLDRCRHGGDGEAGVALAAGLVVAGGAAAAEVVSRVAILVQRLVPANSAADESASSKQGGGERSGVPRLTSPPSTQSS